MAKLGPDAGAISQEKLGLAAVVLRQLVEEFGQAELDEAVDQMVAFLKEKGDEDEKRRDGVAASWAATLLDDDDEVAERRRKANEAEGISEELALVSLGK